MKQSIRHQKIVELVKQKGYLSTDELVDLFGVSPQTIRRDLNELAETNFIRRHHGGAASPSTAENSDYHDRKHFFSQKKIVSQNRLYSSSQTVLRCLLTSAPPPRQLLSRYWDIKDYVLLPIISMLRTFLCKMIPLISPWRAVPCAEMGASSANQPSNFYRNFV